MLDGAVQREERQTRFTAVMVANIINTCGMRLKRGAVVTVEKLLGLAPQGRMWSDMSDEERSEYIARRIKAAKRRGKQKGKAKTRVRGKKGAHAGKRA